MQPNRRRELIREWWWTVLPAAVALSIGVSTVAGGPAPAAPRHAHAVSETRLVAPMPSTSRDVPPHLPFGHPRPSPVGFDRCLTAQSALTRDRARRYCLARAHLTPASGRAVTLLSR